MSNLNTNDFDNFLNLDNESAPSSSILSSSQPVFSGPSYQYDSHRQQTGLPMGGLANTFAVNQASGLHYRPGNMGFVMPTETLNIPLSNLDDFDFGRSNFDMTDMDFDAESPSDPSNLFYSPGSSQIKSESSQSTPIQRIYPGMHSQQAAQAKQRQQEMFRQQQQPKQIPGQLPLPPQASKIAKDPHVEESISRLLNRMRQSSTSSAAEDDTPAPNGGASNSGRSRKDEEDMDEDERLLASEEGKKLSSKERRQLRNKVSARAFRSRRKEYIGQLEGEVAAKVQEANDLRVQNRQLMEENNRLTDLTRMLLSSQAFSGFLQELSSTGGSLPSSTTNQLAQQPQRQARKDVAAHEATRQLQSQNQQHVGMTMIPETNVDVSDFSANWAVPLPSNDFQVFSVTAMPELPTFDMEALLEKKTTRDVTGVTTSTLSKKETPELPSLPPSVEAAQDVLSNKSAAEDTVVDDDDDACDLYAETTTTTLPAQSVRSLIASLQKPHPTTQTAIVSSVEHEADLSSRLEQMCSEMEESCIRLAKYLP